MSNVTDVGQDINPRTDSKTGVVKCGHLKKQGGARGGRKNWKRRWFVLKSDYICYFQEKDGRSTDGPCLGVLPLRYAKVISVEQIPDDGSPSSQTSTTATHATSPLVTTCYICHKPFTKKIICKSCQNVFCMECASELQMGDKNSRVCSKCRCHHADEDPIKEKGSALELGIIVEVTQRESRNLNSKFFKKERPPHLFAVKTKERELWLAAEDTQEKAFWINAIAEVIMSFKKSATGTTEPLLASKEEEDVPSGTHQWEIDYEAITILEKIGDGAFGEVFKGRLWGTDVAVKTIKPDQATEGVVEDLKKEVAILSQLRHPNVVLYIGACTKPPNVCIVTEWCDRGSLHDVLHDSNIPLDIQRIVSLAVGIAQGMNYLHSLERRIIHRDLKSHNVVVDRNFNVKVADFGLSHVRESLTQRNPDSAVATQIRGLGQRTTNDSELLVDDEKSMKITSESMGGHYGVFGTPEWMAPEIMEGTAYNQKVDVYSFGIMMSELLTRKLPFRDQYKIKSYLDVVDAVLDDGAMPTLPPWIGARLKRLIELCLSRNANSRPSFTSIILKLRSIFASSPADLFIAFDIARITHMLSSTDRHNQALAAKEISLFKFDHEFLGDGERRVCARCKYSAAQHRPLDDATITLFISKLTDMLASSSAKVVLPAVEALERLIMIGRQRPEANMRIENLRTICEKNGVERLIGLVASKSERLSQMASRALMLLVDDLPVDDMSYRALKPTSLNVLSTLMMKEIVDLRESSHKLNEALQEKKDTVSALKSSISLLKTVSETPTSGTALSEAVESTTTELEMTPAPAQLDTRELVKVLSQSEQPAQVTSVFEAAGAVSSSPIPSQAKIAIQPILIVEEAMCIEVSAAQLQPASAVDAIASTKESRLGRQQTSGSEPDGTSIANSAINVTWPPTPSITIPSILPASALDPQSVFADWVLVHNPNTQSWRSKYVIVQPSLILIYPSYDAISDPTGITPESIINASVPAGKKLKYKTGRRYKQQFCFHLCCQGTKWWFALRSDKDTVLWGNILVLTRSEPIEVTMRRYMQLPNVEVPISTPSDTGIEPCPFSSLSQQVNDNTPTLDSAITTAEASTVLIAVMEAGVPQHVTSEIVATPAIRTGALYEKVFHPVQNDSVFSPPDSGADNRSGKDVASDAEELDKSQIEMQFGLSDMRSSFIEDNSSDIADKSITPDSTPKDGSENIVYIELIQTPDEQPMPSSSQYSLEEIQAPVNDSSSATEYAATESPAHDDDYTHDYRSVHNLKYQQAEEQSTSTKSLIHEPQVPMTPLALFSDNIDGPLTVRHRDESQHDHFPIANNRKNSSAVDFVTAKSEDHDDLSIVQHSDTSGAAAADTIHEEDEDSLTSDMLALNFDVLPQHESTTSMKVGIEVNSIAVSTRDVKLNSEENANGFVPIAATSSSTTESSPSTMANRFVKRYIDVAAPTTVDAKVNLCLTIKPGDDSICIDKHPKMKSMPSVPSLPAIFLSEYGRRDCWQFEYLIIANISTMKWERRFVILLGSHPRRLLTFKSHESLDLVDEFVLEGLSHVANERVVEHCLGFSVNVDPRLAFAVPVRSTADSSHRNLLCICGSEVEKNKWMSLIERVVLVSRCAT